MPALSPAEHPAPAGAMVPRAFTVVRRRQDTADTWTLELRSAAGEGLAFAPGQFTMLSAGGNGEVPISISGDPDDGSLLVHTVRSVGLATRAICAAQPGHLLGVRGPFGNAWPVEEIEGADVLIAAGGIGLAPLRGAILRLLARRERYGRLTLLYGGRSPDQLIYSDELQQWAARGLDVAVTVDSAGPAWLGHVGVVTSLVRRTALDAGSTVALLCGPEVMMRFMVAVLDEHGVAGERTYASIERNMQCAIGHCGHCQLGPTLICRDGAVYLWSEVARWLAIREL